MRTLLLTFVVLLPLAGTASATPKASSKPTTAKRPARTPLPAKTASSTALSASRSSSKSTPALPPTASELERRSLFDQFLALATGRKDTGRHISSRTPAEIALDRFRQPRTAPGWEIIRYFRAPSSGPYIGTFVVLIPGNKKHMGAVHIHRDGFVDISKQDEYEQMAAGWEEIK